MSKLEMFDGEQLPIWKPEKTGAMLTGVVVGTDQHGGMAELGYLDIDTGDEPIRFYLNSSAKSAVENAMSHSGYKSFLDLSTLKGKEIAIKYKGTQTTAKGYQVKTYSIGVAKA